MVCVVGDKYGFRPIPASIDKEVFEVLLGSVRSHVTKGSDSAYELLKKWYRLDENSKRPEYILQPVSTYYPNAFNHTTDAKAEQIKKQQGAWGTEHIQMTRALQRAAREVDVTAFSSSQTTEKDFRSSVTEKEIEAALTGFVASEKVKVNAQRMFLFLRSLEKVEGLEGNNNDVMQGFVDRLSSGEVDVDAQESLQKLKDTCKDLFPHENVYR